MQADNLITQIKNHPTFTILVFVGTLVIALATFTDAVTKLIGLTETASPEQARIKLAQMTIPYDDTHFVEAAGAGDLLVVGLFLTAEINPNVLATEGKFAGETALMASAGYDRLEIVEALLKAKADVNLRRENSPYGDPAWSYAIAHEKIFNLLLTHGVNDQNINEAFLTTACQQNIA
ncbi:MAG: ankyrin repeat domain-containing protein [Gammaproteobacteria bacterium]